MGARYAELPSRFHNPIIEAESPEHIADAVSVYPGNYTYNLTGGNHYGRNALPAIRNQGAYGGGFPYPTFHQEYGDIFVINKRFSGETGKLPRLPVGTVATLEGYTVVNIPQGRNYPNSRYEQRAVEQRDAVALAIGTAIFDHLNAKPAETDVNFYSLLIRKTAKHAQAMKEYKRSKAKNIPKE